MCIVNFKLSHGGYKPVPSARRLDTNCHWHSTTQFYEGYWIQQRNMVTSITSSPVITVIVYYALAFRFSRTTLNFRLAWIYWVCFSHSIDAVQKFCVLRLSKLNGNNNKEHFMELTARFSFRIYASTFMTHRHEFPFACFTAASADDIHALSFHLRVCFPFCSSSSPI